MNPDLSNQVAVVTGAGRGIGRGIARALAGCGSHVYLAARTESELKAVAAQIKSAGGSAAVAVVDLSDEAQIVGMIETIGRIHGRLDVLVNNAGIGVFGPVKDFAAADLDRMHAVNVRGTFICCREALKLMIPKRSGYIINLASSVGVDTEMVTLARPDLPRDGLIAVDEIAKIVLYLLSLGPTSAAVDEIYIRRKTSSPF